MKFSEFITQTCQENKQNEFVNFEVAIAGGRNDGSKGLEVFNPRDGSVTVLSEVLPQEELSDNQLQV